MRELPLTRHQYELVDNLKAGESVVVRTHIHGWPKKVAVIKARTGRRIPCKLHKIEKRSDRKGLRNITQRVRLTRLKA